jgi:hypothetical protein
MNRLDHPARAYWCAARRVRSGAATEGDLVVLAALLRTPAIPDRLSDGAADAVAAALDAHGINLRGLLVEALS